MTDSVIAAAAEQGEPGRHGACATTRHTGSAQVYNEGDVHSPGAMARRDRRA